MYFIALYQQQFNIYLSNQLIYLKNPFYIFKTKIILKKNTHKNKMTFKYKTSNHIINQMHNHKSSNQSKNLKNSNITNQLSQQLISYNNNKKSQSLIHRHHKFGQESFVQKLKNKTTKHIDNKSIKTIQRYLQKYQDRQILKSFHSLNYLPRVSSLNVLPKTNSLQDISLDGNLVDGSPQLIENVHSIETNNNQIPQYIQHNQKTRQYKYKQQNVGLKKKQRPTLKYLSQIYLKDIGKNGENNDKNSHRNVQFHVIDKEKTLGPGQKQISFRNNYQWALQQQFNQQKNSNKFYQGKQRPTTDSQIKINQSNLTNLNPTNKINHHYRYKHDNLQQDHLEQYKMNIQLISRLIDENTQQKQIIEMQQNLLEKLNNQLQSAMKEILTFRNQQHEKHRDSQSKKTQMIKQQGKILQPEDRQQEKYQNDWQQQMNKLRKYIQQFMINDNDDDLQQFTMLKYKEVQKVQIDQKSNKLYHQQQPTTKRKSIDNHLQNKQIQFLVQYNAYDKFLERKNQSKQIYQSSINNLSKSSSSEKNSYKFQ